MLKLFQKILLLVTLLAVIVLPPLFSGRQAEVRARLAQTRGNPAEAAKLYELAARRIPWRAVLWQEAGLAAASAGEMQAAIRLFDHAQERNALTLPGEIALGRALWQTGDRDAALTIWQTSLSGSNPDPDLLGYLVEAYRTLGNLPAEREMLLLLISVRPQDAQAHYRLGLLLAAEQPETALPELMEAARLDPALDNTVQAMRKALTTALLVDEPAHRLVISGQGLASLGEWTLARHAFTSAVQARPDYAEAWAWLGEAEQHLGRDGSAALELAASLNPESPLVQVFLGLYRQRQGRPDWAINHFRLAALLEPENPAWQAALAGAYVQAGDLPPALQAYQEAVRLAPQDAQYWRMLAVFCANYQYQVTETGLPAARRALTLTPDDARALDVMGQLYMALGDRHLAQGFFEQALEADPTLAEAHLHLGIIHLQSGRRNLAYPALVQARDLASGTLLGGQAQALLEQYFP